MSNYRNMNIPELREEQEAWDSILNRPKGPSEPSNEARETALRHFNEIEGWLARRELEKRG